MVKNIIIFIVNNDNLFNNLLELTMINFKVILDIV